MPIGWLTGAPAGMVATDWPACCVKVVSHGRYATFQMAEIAVSRQMFDEILALIARLRAPPALA